ncbi:MAG TPA: FemAB family XrtA/PEP-CTERM system-associated protein [Candidatus Acidoferrum sp.]|nr:FemAB family XrtA/PEP-CTERM system-associated protein [Candidatus Acidoferrum sp.]
MALDLPRREVVVEIVAAERVGKAWDRFVEVHPGATIGHVSAWGRVIHDAYGHESIALAAVDEGEVVGVLPLVFVRSRLFGDHLVSMPFLDYGGILVDPETSRSDVSGALFEAALGAARARGARSLGLRQFDPLELAEPVTDDRVTMLLPLSTADTVWKSLPSERRNRVRKGEKSGLSPVWGGAELLDGFYEVFAANMRDLGSPVHRPAFFRSMLAELGDAARVLQVRDGNGRPVGAAVCLFFRDTIAVPWVSSRREAFALCPNFVLYWEVIRFGCEGGYRTLDLGRSFKHAGTFEFKRQWGAHPHPLPWIFRDLVPGAPPSPDRDSTRFRHLADLWTRLPVPVANLVGPWLRRQLPN